MTENKQKLVICGHYGSTNIGDDALGYSLLSNLKNKDITVLSYDPKNTLKLYSEFGVKSRYLLPMGFRSLFRGIFKGELRKTLKAIKACDKFILGGGGLFTDEKLFAVFLWGFHVFCAYRYKKPVYMIGQSVGPLNTKIGKWITKKAFIKAKMIVVRDFESIKVLKELGINQEVISAPDLAFSTEFSSTLKSSENLNKKIEQNNLKGYFIVSLRSWSKNTNNLYKNLDHILGRIVEKYKLLPVLIPFQKSRQNDTELMHNLFDQNLTKYPILFQKFTQDLKLVNKLIKGAKFTLGMRLHSIIFSIKLGVPFIAISYSPKVENLLKDVHLNKFSISPNDIDQVFPLIEHVLKDYKKIIQTELDYSKNAKDMFSDIFSKI